MFERYTQSARRVIFFARYEASQFGCQSIAPEHLLLGLFHESRVALAALGLPANLDAELRAATASSGEKINASVDMPLSSAAKWVLAHGAEESEQLKHENIAPEHLLLGLLRETTPAEIFLRKHGVTLANLRERIARDGIAAPAQRESIGSRPSNQDIVNQLRLTFSAMTGKLTPEVEPAFTFSLKTEEA